MTYAVILASGSGRRFSKIIPKQYMNMKGKPIIVHTLDKFVEKRNINKIIVVVSQSYLKYAKTLLKKNYPGKDFDFVVGGKERYDSVNNAISFIKKTYMTKSKDVILFHEAVRPFINDRIIDENIRSARKYGAAITAYPTTDTINIIEDDFLVDIPPRFTTYAGQAPQTFNFLKFDELNCKLTKEEMGLLTDSAKVFLVNNEKIRFVLGESYNIKITTKKDIYIANAIYEDLEIDVKKQNA